MFGLCCYCHFVVRQDHGFGSPREPHGGRVGFVLSCFFKSKFTCSLLWRERYSRPFHWALTSSINTRVVDRTAIEPNRRVKSEVGSWKSVVGNGKSEVRNQKYGVRTLSRLKSEVWCMKSEVGSRKSEGGRPPSAFVTWDHAQFLFRFVITFRRARRNEI